MLMAASGSGGVEGTPFVYWAAPHRLLRLRAGIAGSTIRALAERKESTRARSPDLRRRNAYRSRVLVHRRTIPQLASRRRRRARGARYWRALPALFRGAVVLVRRGVRAGERVRQELRRTRRAVALRTSRSAVFSLVAASALLGAGPV